MKRRIVTLCGSTRFYAEFQKANYDLTMEGNIVLSVGFYSNADKRELYRDPPSESRGCTPEQKKDLDRLHFDKIAMSDAIMVLNVDGYVGESTRNEIACALLRGKEILWLDYERGGPAWLTKNRTDLTHRIIAIHDAELAAAAIRYK